MDNELPEELKQPLMDLWRSTTPITVTLLPRDAFTAVAALQYACRNPQLSATQRHAAIAVARALQLAVGDVDQIVAKYLELGWDTRHDVVRK